MPPGESNMIRCRRYSVVRFGTLPQQRNHPSISLNNQSNRAENDGTPINGTLPLQQSQGRRHIRQAGAQANGATINWDQWSDLNRRFQMCSRGRTMLRRGYGRLLGGISGRFRAPV